jgi:hypothetical protein
MLKWMFALLMLLSVGACQAKDTANLKIYLEQNPALLLEEVNACERNTNKTPPMVSRCEIVMTALKEIQALIDIQQRDPQTFGKRILRAQIDLAETGVGEDEVKILLAVVAMRTG